MSGYVTSEFGARTPLAILLLAGAAWAQTFEVASVKVVPDSPGFEGMKPNQENIRTSPGNLTIRNASVLSCIRWAYDVRDFQISAPAGVGKNRYDIVAKAAGPAMDGELRPMLQALLASRFKLALHREKRDRPVYILAIAKNGPKLDAAKGDGEPAMRVDNGALVFQNTTMPVLAERLSAGLLRMDRPVLDGTGLDGRFDFTIRLAQDNRELKMSMERGDRDPAFIAGALEPLGLKLQPDKRPVEMLIVDHVEKVPTEN